MLVAGLLAAALAECPDNHNQPVEDSSQRFCCTADTAPTEAEWGLPGTNHECYTGNDVCSVASPAFRCCGIQSLGGNTNGYAICEAHESKDECDNGAPISYEWCGDTTTEPECEIGTTYSKCYLAEMPTEPTEALLCRSATEDFRCCVISPTVSPPASFCYASFDDTLYAGIQPCNNDITTTSSGWSVRCPNPTTTTTNLEHCTGDYDKPVIVPIKGDFIDERFCCTAATESVFDNWGPAGATNHECYKGNDVCAVASPSFRCCGIRADANGYAHCLGLQKKSCDNIGNPSYQWCPDTTTTTANLEPAAIAAIAVTPVLIIAAAAGTAL